MDPHAIGRLAEQLAEKLLQMLKHGDLQRVDIDVVRSAAAGCAIAYEAISGDRFSPNELMHLREATLRKVVTRA